jgi:phosphate-selective porin OprO and OprP
LTLVRLTIVVAAVSAATLLPGTALAQTAGEPALLTAALRQAQQASPAPPQPPALPAAASAPAQAQPTAGFQDGFFIQSANGDNRLLFGLVAQLDGRFSVDDPLPIINTFAMRKVRPTFSGRVARYFDFKIMPDLGSGTTTITDAYFDTRFSPKFRVRTGKDKTPVGYELLIGDAFLLFPERSLASNLVPNRDVGVAVQGDLSPKFFYAGGVYNGVPDGSSSSTDVDTNQGKDLAGRVVVQPFRKTGAGPTGALNGLGFHVGGSTGKQSGPGLPTFRTSVGQTYFAYAVGTTADGTRVRVSPAVFYYYKAFGAFAEFMRTRQRVARSGVSDQAVNHGWDVTGSYVVTGEATSERGVRPASPFDPPAGKWGALQVLARYTEVTFDHDIFALGLAAAGSADKAKSYTVAVNWYPASVFKYYLTYEHTEFEEGTAPPRPDENVILFRVQLGI